MTDSFVLGARVRLAYRGRVMRKVGDTIPAFELPTDDGTTFKFPTGGTAVVYFYPRDNTPGCTREAIAFSAHRAAFEKAGAQVIGVSKDSPKSHAGFREKHKLTIRLVSDAELVVHRIFGAFGEKVMYGKKVEGTIRSTFLLDGAGVITAMWPSVKVDGHAEAVLRVATGAGAEPATKKPAAPKKSVAKKPAAKKPAATKKPAAPKSVAKQPAAK